jgi:hypothetical protein
MPEGARVERVPHMLLTENALMTSVDVKPISIDMLHGWCFLRCVL